MADPIVLCQHLYYEPFPEANARCSWPGRTSTTLRWSSAWMAIPAIRLCPSALKMGYQCLKMGRGMHPTSYFSWRILTINDGIFWSIFRPTGPVQGDLFLALTGHWFPRPVESRSQSGYILPTSFASQKKHQTCLALDCLICWTLSRWNDRLNGCTSKMTWNPPTSQLHFTATPCMVQLPLGEILLSQKQSLDDLSQF